MTLRPRALASTLLTTFLTSGALIASAGLLSPPAQAAPAVPAAPAAPAASAASASFTPAAPVWGTCSSDTLKQLKAECAKIVVPLDYDHPAGAKIKLAISRIKHTTKDYQGVMLVNPGGPGGSGLGLSVLKLYVPNGGGDTYDWIGFDPRGVGASEPAVSCDPNYFGYDRPRYVPASPALSDAWFTKTDAYTKACAQKNGAILEHLTTRDSAMDMESIRKALGEKKINYYGFSYGTYLGQVYGTLYPKRLRRVVFDGTVDPRKIWYDANLDQDVAFDRNIDIWFGWIAKHDDVYHLGTTLKDVRSRFYKTEERLYRDPVKGKGGNLGGSEWVDAFLYAGYYQTTWTDLAQTFSDFVRKGDVAALEAAYLDANGYGDDNGYAVYLGVQCTDTKTWPEKWSTWERDNWKAFAKAPYETWANAWYNEPCRHWPAKPHKEVKINGKKVKSLLMINETLDAATPYAGSLEVRKRFPKARLIAEPGGTTHSGSLYGNACVDDRIADYLATGKLPKRKSGKRADVECAPLPQPDPSPAAQQKKAGEKAAQPQAKRPTLKDLTGTRGALLHR
ncbi:alpha/beta hydrolase [Microlunatus flavus]|uniref:Alpha/beta hydrolase fold n=1 Tax=Microlunatus flavus TaxID=1036181 RepID=A0A1H9FAA3_9ACTN|nr:alpha/beta hydrolase [Microlunatus flavus]SEQ34851.1 alpha/beta hydrolase fold [Microlunatus flavus]